MMTMRFRLILLANDHLMLWLPARSAVREPGRLLARVRAGRWRLPPEILGRFFIPPNLRLRMQQHGAVIILRAEPPLRERRPAPALSPEQRAVLRLLAQGQTADQIAAALARRRRWVCYQIAEIRRKLGVATRAEVLKARM